MKKNRSMPDYVNKYPSKDEWLREKRSSQEDDLEWVQFTIARWANIDASLSCMIENS